MHAGPEQEDLGHPAVSRGVASLVMFRCGGAGCLLLFGIREHGIQATLPWAVVMLCLLAVVNGEVLHLRGPAPAQVVTRRSTPLADLTLAVAVNVWFASMSTDGVYLEPYQDTFSIYLTGTVMLWTFLRGVRVGLWAAALGLLTHWATGLLNGYGAAAFTDATLFERQLWLLLAAFGAAMVSKGVADGLRAERRALAEGARAGRAEAEARILRDAHGGVLPTLVGIRHLALGGGGDGGAGGARDRAAIIELVHDCETTIRRRLVDWNGGWSELRAGIEDEIARLRKRRQLAGEPALLIDVVEVGAQPPVGAAVCAALVGAVGEAVRNAGRHAYATRITVRVHGTAERLSVVVRDDGCGFRDRREGFGVRHSILLPLAAVDGTAELCTGPAQGSRWEFRVPLAAPPPSPLGLGMTAHGQSAAVAAR